MRRLASGPVGAGRLRSRRGPRALTIALLCALSTHGCTSADDSQPAAAAGVLDLSAWDASQAGFLRASGEWHLYWQRSLSSSSFLSGSGSGSGSGSSSVGPGGPALHDPSLEFDRTLDGQTAADRDHEGWGTYHLRVILPPRSAEEETADPWMIAIESQGRPYQLEVFDRDGRPLTPPLRAGKTGTSAQTSTPSDRDLNRPLLPTQGDTLDLLLHTSYFDTGYRTRGSSVSIGRSSALGRSLEGGRQNRLIVIGVCIVMGLYHLAIFVLRRGERAPLFFALLCLTFALRQFFRFDLFEDRTPGLDAFPLHASLEYISFYCSIPLFIAFLRALFPLDLPRAAAVGISAFAAVASLLTLLPLGQAARILDVYELFTVLVVLLAAVAVGRAIYFKRDPPVTRILGVGVAILLAATLHDILHNLAIISSAPLEYVGMFAFIFAQAMVLALLNMRARKQAEDLSAGLRRFVPGEFSQILGKHDITDVDLGDAALEEMTVLFCDIRGFTRLSERHNAGSTFSLLNTIYAKLAPLIREHGGFIDKYIGDAIMAIFPGPPEDSLGAAVAIVQATRSINLPHDLTSSTHLATNLAVGIGIHRGPVMLGTIGEHQRMEATVIADAVNIASRLEGLSKRFGAGILISGELFASLEERALASDPLLVEGRPLGSIRLAGKRRSVRVHEIFAPDPPATKAEKLRTKARFAAALAHFQRGDFATAAARFASLTGGPGAQTDRAAEVYAAAAADLAKSPPADWDGTLVIAGK